MATGGGEIFDRLRTAGTGVDGPTVPGQAQRDGPPHAARATGYEHSSRRGGAHRALGSTPSGASPPADREGAENLIRPCEQEEWIEAMECVNSILAMSGDVLAEQTHDRTFGRTR